MSTIARRNRDISGLIKSQVRKLAAYHIDETRVRIKLDAMENPFHLPEKVRTDIAAIARKTPINRYPDPSATDLKKAIGSYWKMRPEQMILGNGSDELIQTIILAFGGPVLIPVPTFAMYDITSRALAQNVVTVPLTDTFDLDADQMLKKARDRRVKVIFLACPNNPTGNRFSDSAVKKVLANAEAAVVIDEAYFSFSGETYLPLLKKYPNMIILRTLSKIGFAGLRVGVLTASKTIVDELNKIRLPYNINSLSQAVALALLKHRTVLDRQISLLISERTKLLTALSKMQGLTVYPSETNFILFKSTKDASAIHAKLKKAGILIKNLNRQGPLSNCLRVTVGTPAENQEFVGALKKIMNADQKA